MRTYTVRGVCHAAPLNDGLFWFYNASSAMAVYLFELRCDPAGGGGSVNDPNTDMPSMTGSFEVRRVTAVNGGTAGTFIKHVSTSSNIPSQVQAFANLDGYTSTDVFRRGIDGLYYSSSNTYTGNPSHAIRWQAYKRGRGKQRSQSTIWSTGDSNDAPIILAEGEGISIHQTAFAWPQPRGYRFILRNTSSNACYLAWVKAMPAAQTNEAIACVFNGSGSGVTLAVEAIELDDLGETWMTNNNRVSPGPFVRLVWCHRIRTAYANDPSAGNLTPVAHRSDAPLPANTVTCYRGPFQPMLPGNEASHNTSPAELYETHGTLPAASVINMQMQIEHDTLRFWKPGSYCKDVSAASYFPLSGTRPYQKGAEGVLWTTRGSNNVDALQLMPGEGIAIAAHVAPWLSNSSALDGTSTTIFDVGCTFGLKEQPGMSSRLGRVIA